MEYPQAVDTLRGFWPGGQETPTCVVELNLAQAYQGSRWPIKANGRTQFLRIPPGVHSGARVYLPRVSTATTHAVDFCTIRVDDQPPFKRCGDNLHLEHTIDAFTAILGGAVAVPTLFGQTTLNVPPGTAPGTTLHLPGLGMPVFGHPQQHGDLCIHLKVSIPQDVSKLERRLIDDNFAIRGWKLHAD